mmetsp:Transcript_19372/g.32904  ORF Transcript_19372/g.32904 Transcript_19372/m.32904 type:complete len:265 (-) Transcript_19372:74-868(-)
MRCRVACVRHDTIDIWRAPVSAAAATLNARHHHVPDSCLLHSDSTQTAGRRTPASAVQAPHNRTLARSTRRHASAPALSAYSMSYLPLSSSSKPTTRPRVPLCCAALVRPCTQQRAPAGSMMFVIGSLTRLPATSTSYRWSFSSHASIVPSFMLRSGRSCSSRRKTSYLGRSDLRSRKTRPPPTCSSISYMPSSLSYPSVFPRFPAFDPDWMMTGVPLLKAVGLSLSVVVSDALSASLPFLTALPAALPTSLLARFVLFDMSGQ